MVNINAAGPATFRLEARIAGGINDCEPGLQDTVRFSTSGYTLTLRLPEHGDGVGRDLRLIQHRNRSGTLYVYARGNTVKSINGLQFIGLKRSEVQTIETYIEATRGMKMQYYDAWGDPYTGVISNWNARLSQRRKGYEVSIDFVVQ